MGLYLVLQQLNAATASTQSWLLSLAAFHKLVNLCEVQLHEPIIVHIISKIVECFCATSCAKTINAVREVLVEKKLNTLLRPMLAALLGCSICETKGLSLSQQDPSLEWPRRRIVGHCRNGYRIATAMSCAAGSTQTYL